MVGLGSDVHKKRTVVALGMDLEGLLAPGCGGILIESAVGRVPAR